MNKVITSVLTTFLMVPVFAWSDIPRPSIVILGDSLSDGAALGNRKGNNNWLHSDGRSEQTGPGAPVTNWPNDNPSIWVNHMAEEFYPGDQTLGFLFESPQTQPLILNAAFASAETGSSYLNDKSDEPYPPVESECKSYGDYTRYSCVPGVMKQISLVSDKNIDWSQTYVIVWAGANDLFNDVKKLQVIFGEDLTKGNTVGVDAVNVAEELKLLKSKNDLSGASIDVFFRRLTGYDYSKYNFSNPISNTKDIINALISKQVSVENIMMIGLPDLGQLPVSSGLGLASELLSFLSESYNKALKNWILKDETRKGLTFVDIIDWQRQQVKDSGWVQSALTKTCASDKKQELCREYSEGSPEEKPYLFFNGKHPTADAHKKIWQEIKRQAGQNANSASLFNRLANSTPGNQQQHQTSDHDGL